MAALCIVTGILVGPDGTLLANQQVSFVPPAATGFLASAGATAVQYPVETETDAEALLSVGLVPGWYEMKAKVGLVTYSRRIPVPATGAADLADLVDTAGEPQVAAWLIEGRAKAEEATGAAGTAVEAAGLAVEAAGAAVEANDAVQLAAPPVLAARDTMLGLDTRVPIVALTAGRAFLLSDAGCLVAVDAAAPQVMIAPAGDVGFAIGTVIEVLRIGTGALTLAPAPGASLLCPHEARGLPRYGRASFVKFSDTQWLLAGDLI